MHKRILIIGRNHHPDGKETAKEIYDGLLPFIDADHQLSLAYFNDLLFDISNDSQTIVTRDGEDLAAFDAILMTNWFSHASVRKDMAFTVALYCNAKHVTLFNSEALYSRSSSKLSQMMLAALHDVPIARTIFSLSFDRLSLVVASDAGLDAPFILKDAQASRGKGNYLLSTYEEMPKHRTEHSELHPFVAQQFIASNNTDYRFFVAAGAPRLVIKRLGSGKSHVTNTSSGATTELLAPDIFSEPVLHAVDTMSRVLHREVTGIDIMFDKEQNPYFLEANPIPQIATGSNVEHKLRVLAEALQQT